VRVDSFSFCVFLQGIATNFLRLRSPDIHLSRLAEYWPNPYQNSVMCGNFLSTDYMNVALADMLILRRIPERIRRRVGYSMTDSDNQAFVASILEFGHPARWTFDQPVRASTTRRPKVNDYLAYKMSSRLTEAHRRIKPVKLFQRTITWGLPQFPDISRNCAVNTCLCCCSIVWRRYWCADRGCVRRDK